MVDGEIVYIYGLVDPITNQLRYIGKSVNPKSRFRRHIADINLHDSYKDRWIRYLVEKGFKPTLLIIDIVNKDEWIYWEKFYISYFKFIGFNMVNGTLGGDEPPSTKGRKHTEESKLKMSNTKKGKPIPWLNNDKPRSEEHKKNLSNSLKGRKSEKKGKKYEDIYGEENSNIIRKKLSDAHKGLNCGVNHPMYNKKHDKETIEKIRKKRSEQIFSKESIKKRANALKKKVYKYDLEGNLVKIYDSLGEAYKEISYKKLNRHFENGTPINGYIWKKELNKIK
jgi:group I intron endonuclease